MDTQKAESLWTHLHWLNVLANLGSYTAAATRLGVSKAAMSQRIAELERVAGVALVQRTTRSVRFTEAGQRLVEETRGEFERIAASFAGVREMADVARGTVRVTAPVAFARQQLVPHLAQFARAHPEVRVQLEMSDRLTSIASEGFDLAIRHSAQVPETHVAWKLCDTRSVIVATRTYLKQRGTPQTPADLAQHDCLFYPRALGSGAWSFEKAGRRAENPRVNVTVNGPFSANNSEALRDAALEHLGIALLPDFSAQAALQAGKLVVLLPNWRPVGAFASQLHVVRPYGAHVPRAVSSFAEFLRQTFKAGFPLE
ncbi:LysR family transcriptional regulator [Paraburkholderia sp. Ac-20340]|uniref:LysR family transcriptional regulator n=1 Tax=Paraburkholderia sp. Ac-20340 TaxID=2703888 RepID=UPI00197E4EEC|nr:LysR family transcriptional regulator [Paraburkholderia sp. Ac-20340]MBN3856213.1 LysR family transcriptional regulator [Paraburkholderia sp. Ac-20340]